MGISDAALFALLTLAAAAGFGAGRWRGSVPDEVRSPSAPSLPLTNPPIEFAVDAILRDVRIDDDSIDVFLALGTLVRRRGELDKAIELHRALQARAGLGGQNRERVQLELARDYLHGGLLGTAEHLLDPLAHGRGPVAEEAGADLMEVYEQERDWSRAERLARAAVAGGSQASIGRLGHYLCEQAEAALAAFRYDDARTLVQDAVQCDPRCVRGWLTLGRIEISSGALEPAIAALHRAGECDPRFIVEVLPLLQRACIALQQVERFDAYLDTCVERHPAARIAPALAERLHARGDVAGVRRVWQQELERHRDVPALRGWVAAHADEVNPPWPPELLATLDALLADTPAYRCDVCGFSAAELHWHCPSCRHWGSARPVGSAIRATATPAVQ